MSRRFQFLILSQAKRKAIIFIQTVSSSFRLFQILQLNIMNRILIFTLFLISLHVLSLQHHLVRKQQNFLHYQQNNASKVIDGKVGDALPVQNTLNCPEKQVYNKTEQKCMPLQKNLECSSGNVYDQKLKQCRILCDDHKHYNYKEQKCLANSLICERDERYSRKNKKCVKIDRNCKPGFVFNQKSLLCKKVVNCASDEELNPRWQICEKKKIICSKGQLLDYKTNSCVARKFITNPYHDKLSYIGDFKNYVSYYNTAKNIDKLLTDCLFTTPFYQKSTDMCIACPQNTPIFDLTNDKCIACQYNQVYNAYQHKCRDQKLHYEAPISMWRMGL